MYRVQFNTIFSKETKNDIISIAPEVDELTVKQKIDYGKVDAPVIKDIALKDRKVLERKNHAETQSSQKLLRKRKYQNTQRGLKQREKNNDCFMALEAEESSGYAVYVFLH